MSDYYVHFNLHNYVYYGIYKSGEVESNENKTLGQLRGYLNKHNQIIRVYKQKAKNNEGRIKHMEDFYTKLFNPNDKSDNNINKIREIYLQEVNKIVEKTCKDRAGQITEGNLLQAMVNEDPNSTDTKYRIELKKVLDTSINDLVVETSKKSAHYKEVIHKLQNIIEQTQSNSYFKDLMEAQLTEKGITGGIREVQEELQKMLQNMEMSKAKIFSTSDESVVSFSIHIIEYIL